MTTSQKELLPCPFCGGKDLQQWKMGVMGGTVDVVTCEDCNGESLREVWNRRAIQSEPAPLLVSMDDVIAESKVVRPFCVGDAVPVNAPVRVEDLPELPKERVALHGDGYFVWIGPEPYAARDAFWRCGVFTADQMRYYALSAVRALSPPVQPAQALTDDRKMLIELMERFDNEFSRCERCGHQEDTKDMDSAHYLRRYLEGKPQ